MGEGRETVEQRRVLGLRIGFGRVAITVALRFCGQGTQFVFLEFMGGCMATENARVRIPEAV